MKYPVTAIFSKRGGGKSTLMRRLILDRAPARYVIVDPMREHGVVGGGIARTFKALERLIQARTPKMRLIYQPSEVPRGKHFDDVAKLVYDAGDYVLAVDEVDLFVKLHEIPPHFNACIQQGRHRGVRVIYATRRASSISKDLTSQTDEAFLGRMHEPRDLKYLRDAFGTIADRVPHLPKFGFAHWIDGEDVNAPSEPPAQDNQAEEALEEVAA